MMEMIKHIPKLREQYSKSRPPVTQIPPFAIFCKSVLSTPLFSELFEANPR